MKIRELLDSPEKWTKQWYAYNKEGRRTNCSDDDATCWCLMGAVAKCYGSNIKEEKQIIQLLNKETGGNVVEWNDNPERKFDEVKALVERLDV